VPNLSPKPYPNPSTHPGEVSKGEWGDAWEGFVSEARGVWFTVRSARDDGQRFIEKMRRFWGLRCLAKHRAELSSCIPASPFVAKLMSAVSDGGEDQGAEEAIGAKRESFSSVLEAVSRASGSPFSAFRRDTWDGMHISAERMVFSKRAEGEGDIRVPPTRPLPPLACPHQPVRSHTYCARAAVSTAGAAAIRATPGSLTGGAGRLGRVRRRGCGWWGSSRGGGGLPWDGT